MRGRVMPEIIPLKNWVVIGFQRDAEKISTFIGVLKKSAFSLGMQIEEPVIMTVKGSHEVEACVRKQKGAQMYMIIIPRSESKKYGDLKRVLACQHGVLSQFVLSQNMEKKGVMSIATKIAIQINAKL